MLENIKSIFFVRSLFSLLNEKRKLKIIKYNQRIQKTLSISLLNYKIYNGRYIIYELKNGKGKIKEYDDNGKIKFEGDYFNGERNGKGKEYDFYNGKLTFEGEYINGLRNGKGKEYWKNKLTFEGEYLNGRRNGTGKNINIMKI